MLDVDDAVEDFKRISIDISALPFSGILLAPPICFIQRHQKPVKKILVTSLAMFAVIQSSPLFADVSNGRNLYMQRCAMCHGTDLKGTGPLATKSTPPTPDLTTSAFRKRLNDYPGVIVSSIILRPNGDLIPKTLRENRVRLAPHAWSVQDFRDIHQYMSGVISSSR